MTLEQFESIIAATQEDMLKEDRKQKFNISWRTNSENDIYLTITINSSIKMGYCIGK
jgi:hypothetical protein